MITLPSIRAAAMSRGYLVAFDPGVDHPAVAVFLDGELCAASRVRVPGALDSLEVGERCRQIALLVRDWVLGHTYELHTTTGAPAQVANVVAECPQVYRVAKSKGDPNNLIPLAVLDGYVAGLFPTATVTMPKPAEWIGGLKKSTTGDPWKSPRGRLIWRLLRESERPRVQASHDSIDACGIGLWCLGRLGRVFPGSV